MGKLEDKRAAEDAVILASVKASIEGVLADPLVVQSEALLDEVAAELLGRLEWGDPLSSLRSQVLRSTSSIVGNLVEGAGKGHLRDNRKFLLTARGSAYETVVWLRALGRASQANAAVDLCHAIDQAIAGMFDASGRLKGGTEE